MRVCDRRHWVTKSKRKELIDIDHERERYRYKKEYVEIKKVREKNSVE